MLKVVNHEVSEGKLVKKEMIADSVLMSSYSKDGGGAFIECCGNSDFELKNVSLVEELRNSTWIEIFSTKKVPKLVDKREENEKIFQELYTEYSALQIKAFKRELENSTRLNELYEKLKYAPESYGIEWVDANKHECSYLLKDEKIKNLEKKVEELEFLEKSFQRFQENNISSKEYAMAQENILTWFLENPESIPKKGAPYKGIYLVIIDKDFSMRAIKKERSGKTIGAYEFSNLKYAEEFISFLKNKKIEKFVTPDNFIRG